MTYDLKDMQQKCYLDTVFFFFFLIHTELHPWNFSNVKGAIPAPRLLYDLHSMISAVGKLCIPLQTCTAIC